MNGLPSFEKKMRQMRQSAQKRPPRAQMIVGSWKFEEDADGNLVIRHLDSEQVIVLARPIGE